MASLRDIRSRITSVKSTRQITSAMKMVSAAKLKKAQDRISSIRPYVKAMNEIIDEVAEHTIDKYNSVFTSAREEKTILVVLISSNRGLCGAFNANVGKKAIKLIEEKYPQQANENNVKFFCFGKKSKDFIKKTKYPIIETNTDILNDLTYQNITDIANQLMLLFETEEFDKIELVYNSFKIASQSNLIDETYLPFTMEKEKSEFPTDYIFEPDLMHIKDSIIPDFLKTKLFSVFLDSIAAEHGARMTAMHQATDNATELVKELTLQYNKARQAAITTEILEITSGAEALNAG